MFTLNKPGHTRSVKMQFRQNWCKWVTSPPLVAKLFELSKLLPTISIFPVKLSFLVFGSKLPKFRLSLQDVALSSGELQQRCCLCYWRNFPIAIELIRKLIWFLRTHYIFSISNWGKLWWHGELTPMFFSFLLWFLIFFLLFYLVFFWYVATMKWSEGG